MLLCWVLIILLFYSNNFSWFIRATEIPTRILNDGNEIPMLGLGTIVSSIKDVSKLEDAIRFAIKQGYRHIDTAADFENEVQVGRALRAAINGGEVKREDLFITTKLPFDGHDRDQVVPALRESLQQLGLSYVDLYLIHTPTSRDNTFKPTYIDFVETWKGMEEAKKLGLAKSIGISNFEVDQITRIMENSSVKPSVNQIEVNPTYNHTQVIEHCQKLGIAVIAYAPFGFMVERPNYQFGDLPPPRMDDPTLLKLGRKYKKTPAQIVLRFLIDRGLIPIPKSFTKEHLKENINVFDFKLTPEEVKTISQFNRDQGVYSWV